jgi:hypothetical protein
VRRRSPRPTTAERRRRDRPLRSERSGRCIGEGGSGCRSHAAARRSRSSLAA